MLKIYIPVENRHTHMFYARDNAVERFGTPTSNAFDKPQIVHELTCVIKEWGAKWKQLYESHHSNLYELEEQINNLILLREKISNGNFLVHELKEKQKLALLAIDIGNKLFKCDMAVRDEQGHLINPLHTPILWLYKNHKVTSAHVKNKEVIQEYKMLIHQIHFSNNYCVHVAIKNKDQSSQSHYGNVDYLKNMDISKVMSPCAVKSDLYRILTNRDFWKGIDLLNHLRQPSSLLEGLTALKKLNTEILFELLHDILDALFEIYKLNPTTSTFDTLVFDCLVHIIQLVSNENHWKLQRILDLYIEKHFNAEVAYSKLMTALINYLKHWDQADEIYLINVYKSFKYIMKFIVRSKSLSSEINKDKDQQMFEKSMKEILTTILSIMRSNSDSAKYLHCACVKYVPQFIPDITTVFSCSQLSSFLVELLDCLDPTSFVTQTIITMKDIVHSQLFLNASCRAILLPCLIGKIKNLSQSLDMYLWSKKKLAKLCGDILDILYITDEDSKFNDISVIMTTTLPVVIVKVLDRKNSLEGYVASLMISILYQMTDKHFDDYVKNLVLSNDLLDFLKKVLFIFIDMISHPIYPANWCDMIMLQNSVILKSLKHFAHAIREYFFDKFEESVWTDFFHCAFTFLLQPSLQLEKFSCNKRSRILGLYKDMRIESGILIQTMWSYLRLHKVHFMPDMVSAFLETSLIPESELRKIIIPVFFDMMQCEFYSLAGNSENNRHSSNRNAKFDIFQNKMIENIDRLVIDGKGDKQFKELFETIMLMHCENHSTMRDQGISFVENFTNLFERLLEYQLWINDENIDNRINCTVNVLNLYKDIQKHELIVSYVNKLCSLHLECGNFTEAAYTLKMHSELLSWSNDPLPPSLKSLMRYPTCETHSQLKEALLIDTIDYFNKGKSWEYAVTECEELAAYYKSHTYEYSKLCLLLHSKLNLYDQIMNKVRMEPQYYRVAYYGRGFPLFLQNKVFVYREEHYECSIDLSNSIMNQFPNATLMQNLITPGPEITDSFNQYIQINNVKPIMNDIYKNVESISVMKKVLQHFRVNNVIQFNFSLKSKRVNVKENSNDNNEFANLWIERTEMKTAYPLPNIVRWGPITDSYTYQVSPLEFAIETMEDKNRNLKQLLIEYQNDQEHSINPLSMFLEGVLHPVVMGGLSNYEQAFFTPEYLTNHKEDKKLIEKLKNLICSQTQLLSIGVKLHRNYVLGMQAYADNLYELQTHLETCFKKRKEHIEKNYGYMTHDTPSGNCFDITYREQRHNGSSRIKYAEVLNFVRRSVFESSNSYPSSNDFFNSNIASNKYHTEGRTFLRNETAEKKLTKTYSRSLERITGLSNTSELDMILSRLKKT